MFMANRALASLGSATKGRPEQISALIKLERTKAFLFYSILLYRGARALVLRPRRGPSLGASPSRGRRAWSQARSKALDPAKA